MKIEHSHNLTTEEFIRIYEPSAESLLELALFSRLKALSDIEQEYNDYHELED